MLGIDPGLSRCGYGAVVREAAGLRAAACGVLTTPKEAPLPDRLATLMRELHDLVAELQPDVVVVERVFFQTNARTATPVAQASGLALAIASDAGAAVVQYTSNEVKQSVAGYGAASKEQVQRMVQALLRLDKRPHPADAADALALALCHHAVGNVLARLPENSGVSKGRYPPPNHSRVSRGGR